METRFEEIVEHQACMMKTPIGIALIRGKMKKFYPPNELVPVEQASIMAIWISDYTKELGEEVKSYEDLNNKIEEMNHFDYAEKYIKKLNEGTHMVSTLDEEFIYNILKMEVLNNLVLECNKRIVKFERKDK